MHHSIRIAMRNILILGSIALALVNLGACGSKGPLYLPPPPAASGGAVDNSTAPGAPR